MRFLETVMALFKNEAIGKGSRLHSFLTNISPEEYERN